MDVHVKFGDSVSYLSRDIRAAQFVMYDERRKNDEGRRRRPTDTMIIGQNAFCLKTTFRRHCATWPSVSQKFRQTMPENACAKFKLSRTTFAERTKIVCGRSDPADPELFMGRAVLGQVG